MNKQDLSISKIVSGITTGEFTAEEITTEYLAEAEKKNPEINALTFIDKEGALATAKEIDTKIKNRESSGALCGVPIAIKDNILIEGQVCSAGSKLLKNYIASYDATVIQKLKNAGAVLIGKANMDEFAMGSSNETSAFGSVKNPRDTERVPGGSSGGSAATVAANMAVGALGSDTGGSIRLPAGFCGVVGMKPTYGRVSRFGLMAMASSLDQIGPVSKTVTDAEKIYSVIKGLDARDQTSRDMPESQIAVNNPSSITVGIPKEFFSGKGTDKDTEEAISEAMRDIQSAGIKIKEVSLPNSKYALSTYYIIMFAEVSTNMAKFDGIRYARKASEDDTLLDIYMNTRGDGFGDEVKRRIILGTFVLSAGYYDAYYTKAQKVRRLIQDDFIRAFREVDVIMSPVSPTLPFKFGEKTNDPIQMYLSDIFTMPVNLAGLPAISIPVKNRKNKLPVGFQLIGKHWHDSDLFEIGKFYEGL